MLTSMMLVSSFSKSIRKKFIHNLASSVGKRRLKACPHNKQKQKCKTAGSYCMLSASSISQKPFISVIARTYELGTSLRAVRDWKPIHWPTTYLRDAFRWCWTVWTLEDCDCVLIVLKGYIMNERWSSNMNKGTAWALLLFVWVQKSQEGICTVWCLLFLFCFFVFFLL